MRDLKDAEMSLPQLARTIELIQTAAVAVANIEIEMYGESNAKRREQPRPLRQVELVLELVEKERYRQDELWGPQSGPPAERLMILLEEVGEVAEEIEFQFDAKLEYIRWCAEQVGRKAKAWLESR